MRVATHPKQREESEMTASQYQRQLARQRRREQERRERIETAKGLIALALIVLAFLLAGTIEYQDEMQERSYWADRGVYASEW